MIKFIIPNKNFKDIYPKSNFNKIKKKTELFTSRILNIDNSYLTNEYIFDLKLIHNKNDEIIKNYENKYLKDNFYDFKHSINKINWPSYYYYCISNKSNIYMNNLLYKFPIISVVIPSYNKQNEILKSIRSIQNQSFKNIEIIIVDDCSTDNSNIIYSNLLKNDPRIRIFYHIKNMGVWRSRLDGFLYSRGKYIIHFDAGDMYSDNLVLEDAYNTLKKYNLDSIRFSFKFIRDKYNITNKNKNYYFKKKYTKITFGYKNYDITGYLHGIIWNRLIKKNILFKSFYMIDSYILNAYKNLWEDRWWNILTNHFSFRNLMINRIGYIYFKENTGEGSLKLKNDKEKDNTIHELIYLWLFDLELLPKKNNKKSIINILRKFNQKKIYFQKKK